MTPEARISAAIDVLDRILSGTPGEQALTGWARGNRFAGSSDRAAIRDHVFGALRCRRSYAALGGSFTGRGLMLGALRDAGVDPTGVFTGIGHAPSPLTDAESAYLTRDVQLDPNVKIDCPDWLAPALQSSLGADFAPVMQALRHRAPVFLRVNTRRTTREAAIADLAREGISAQPHALAKNALEVTENARKIQTGPSYLDGVVELQDAASQALVEMLPLADGQRVLDYCAGGGGKTLAMSTRADLTLFAHDADPGRMRDLPHRAKRAGISVKTLTTAQLGGTGSFDLVLTDVPCSGSGSWRRAPEAKWMLTEARLAELLTLQQEILVSASELVRSGGVLAYATCSLLDAENADQIVAFRTTHPGWHLEASRRFTPLDGGDGFFVAVLRRA
jgi:16S rRNA (cytosine967-C5)-methyltransferase